MTAIVTDDLKRRLSQFIFDDTLSGDSNEYYIGIGKPDTYNAQDTTLTPVRTNAEVREVRANLMSVKKVVNSSFIIPRYNWTSGSIYSAYSDASVGIHTNTYYVLTEDNEVYICLQQGVTATGSINQSVVKPNYVTAGVTQDKQFTTADGYIWKLMYGLSAAKSNAFLTSGFIPIQVVDSSTASTLLENQQLAIQSSSQKGRIVNVKVTNTGSGYAGSTTPVKFSGNGHSASATAYISNGSVVKVELDDSGGAVQNGGGTGYTYAKAVISGNAVLSTTLSPQSGIGGSAVTDFKSTSVMYTVKAEGSENDTFTTVNDFRQISLIRNLTNQNNTTPLTGSSYKVGRFIDLTSSISSILPDDIITDDTSGVTAKVVETDSDGSGNTRLRFIQNSNNVIGSFGANHNINQNAAEIGASGDSDGYVDIYSGEVMYIENRAKVQRSADQTEDIKIILTV